MNQIKAWIGDERESRGERLKRYEERDWIKRQKEILEKKRARRKKR